MALHGRNSHLVSAEFPIKSVPLHKPPLKELAEVLQAALVENFHEASVITTHCPDLSQPPFNLSSSGLGGQPCLLDIGSSSYLTPIAQRHKMYDLKDIAQLIGADPAFMIGAGLGPWPYAETNCELIANLTIGRNMTSKTHIAYIKNDTCQMDLVPPSETRCAILVNIFCCKGKRCEVLEVKCKGRKQDDIISCMRQALHNKYKNQILGLGGTFLLTDSQAKEHIMPDFSDVPLYTSEAFQNWIKYFVHDPPLVAVGTFVSADPGLGLKVQHFHGMNNSGHGGHFYSDTQPETANYIGYFAPGEILYTIDKPLGLN